MKMDRICTLCYQRVMANHFKKEIGEEVNKLKCQIEEYNFLYGQEVKKRATRTAKKKILEGILATLERESEARDREIRVKITKLKTKKENMVGKMNNILKKFQELQREREKKEKKIKELDNEIDILKANVNRNEKL